MDEWIKEGGRESNGSSNLQLFMFTRKQSTENVASCQVVILPVVKFIHTI